MPARRRPDDDGSERERRRAHSDAKTHTRAVTSAQAKRQVEMRAACDALASGGFVRRVLCQASGQRVW